MDGARPRRGRGRPPGGSGAREQILESARTRFVEQGYEHVTLRAVAADAGVDVALISYHFGSKRGLFGAAMAVHANPPEVVVRALRGPVETLPGRLVGAVLRAWEDPEDGPGLERLARTALHDPEFGRLFQEMAEREMVARLAERIGGRHASERAALAISQLTGLVVTRYVLRIEPVASMSPRRLAARAVGPLRQALLG